VREYQKSHKITRDLSVLLTLPDGEYITVSEAARLMQMTRQGVHLAINRGILSARVLGKTALITKGDAIFFKQHPPLKGRPARALRNIA